MATIPLSFYLFQPAARDHGLAAMLQKHLARDKRAMVMVDDAPSAKKIDDILWDYSQDEFLPHDIIHHDETDRTQPVLIMPLDSIASNGEEKVGFKNHNQASAIFFMPNQSGDITTILKTEPQLNHGIEQWLFLFSQHDNHHESIMAKIFAMVSNDAKNFTLTQWQQTAKGGWQAQSQNQAQTSGQ